jgi:uncharacterized membrane protein YebE (DUF533 family)
MSDVKNLLTNMDTNGLVGKILGIVGTKHFAAGVLTGGLGTSMLGGGKETLETVAKLGGMALLGTLAYKAVGNYQQQKATGVQQSMLGAVKASATEIVSQTGNLLSGITGEQKTAPALSPEPLTPNPDLSLAILRAMIGAAKADGHMDANESQKIFSQIETANVSSQEKMLLMQEIANPLDLRLIAQASQTPQDAAQIYLAALLVCENRKPSEQDYFSSLAAALRIDPALAGTLQDELNKASVQKAA